MKPQFIWNTYGDWVATLIDRFIWDTGGSWIGWVDGENVYTTDGEWIGTLSRDSRIIRRRSDKRPPLRTDVPAKPAKPDLPSRPPLPPTFGDLGYSHFDVLEEDPEAFKRLSDRRKDMGD